MRACPIISARTRSKNKHKTDRETLSPARRLDSDLVLSLCLSLSLSLSLFISLVLLHHECLTLCAFIACFVPAPAHVLGTIVTWIWVYCSSNNSGRGGGGDLVSRKQRSSFWTKKKTY